MTNYVGRLVAITRYDDQNTYYGKVEEDEVDFIRLIGWVNGMTKAFTLGVKIEKARSVFKVKMDGGDQIELDEKMFRIWRTKFITMDITRSTIAKINIMR